MVTKVQAGRGSRREIIFVNRSELAIVKGLGGCEQGLSKPSRIAEGVAAGGRGLLPVRPGVIRDRERYSV